jgi:hypothetical protein
VFENRVLRRIFGPKRNEVTYVTMHLSSISLYLAVADPAI